MIIAVSQVSHMLVERIYVLPMEFMLFSQSVSSIAQSCPTLCPHRLQHARIPCPSPTPRASWNSCPLSQWYHQAISSYVIPFSSHLQSFPASGSFPVSQIFTWGDQSIGVSASASVFPMNIQDWFPLGLTDWPPWVQRTQKSLLQQHSSKAYLFGAQLSL